jgi:multidrug transporter EmrE-like cation transporter
MLPYLLILVTIIGNTSGLIFVKKAVSEAGQMPESLNEFLGFFIKMITNLYTWLAIVVVFIGLVAFWLTLTKMELGRVYPIVGGLSYILVALFSIILFKENLSVWGWLGVVLVAGGVSLISKV